MILSDEELEEVAPAKSTGIEIQEFVESEISSLYFENHITSSRTRARPRPMRCCERHWRSPERWGLPNLSCETEKVFAY